MIEITPKLLKQLKRYWKELRKMEDEFDKKVVELEVEMAKETGIEDIEFVRGYDGCFCGISNFNRTMPLIFDRELEERNESPHRKG